MQLGRCASLTLAPLPLIWPYKSEKSLCGAAPSWPYETSRVATGLSNLLNDYPQQSTVDRSHYMQLLTQYARAHTRYVLPTLR